MQVVAVRVENGYETALAAVLTRLADPGGLVIVQSASVAPRTHRSHRLLAAVEAAVDRDAAMVLVLQPTAVAELAAIARFGDRTVIAVVPIEAVDPIPPALILGDVVGADGIVLAEQFSTGLVLRRVRRQCDGGRPWDGSPA